jgi:hypothetical protein
MKNSINLFIALLFFNSIYAQNTKIDVQVFVKGKSIELKNGVNVSLISKNDTLKLLSSDNSFYLPDSLNMKKRSFLVQAGGYDFYFEESILTYQPLLPKWEIFVDYKPFLEENKWLLKQCNKKVKFLYSLNKNTGSLFTVFLKKKFKPSQ